MLAYMYRAVGNYGFIKIYPYIMLVREFLYHRLEQRHINILVVTGLECHALDQILLCKELAVGQEGKHVMNTLDLYLTLRMR